MSILDITETPLEDDSIQEYEYAEYLPVAGDVNNLNNNGGTISITIETQDVFTHPSKSYLLIEGELVKEAGVNQRYVDGDRVALTNNGLMYLFSSIVYELSGTEIERIAHPGWATTMLGLLKYDDNFTKSRGLNQLWYKDTTREVDVDNNVGWKARKEFHINKIEQNADKGKFEFRIPLKHIFGFCEDYDMVLYGIKQNLILTRAGDRDAIFRAAPAVVGGNNMNDPGKVTIRRIAWHIPHVLATDKHKMRLYKHIESKDSFPVSYRKIQCDTLAVPQSSSFNWRLSVKTAPEIPRFIIVGFQKGKINNQEQNPAIFNHAYVTDIHVTLISTKYPKKDYKLSFDENKFSRAYGDVCEFKSKFFLTDDLDSTPNFTPLEYKELYPLFLFDVTRQSERLKYSVSDIHIKATFEKLDDADNGIGNNTQAYCVLISDRLIELKSDGSKMTVVI